MTPLIWHERQPQRVITELENGREMAIQLQAILKDPSRNQGRSASAMEIAGNIMRSFTDSIYMITTSFESGEVCHKGGFDDFNFSRKRSELSCSFKDGRGSHKRRKGAQTWTKISSTIEDNHAWRKYGQKGILKAKFPRCYYRCTYKNDQGCQATKQVQRTEDNPAMYHITYAGVHTCRRSNNGLSPQIITKTDPRELSGNGPNPHIDIPSDYAVVAMNHEVDTPSDVNEYNSLVHLETIFDRDPVVGSDHRFVSISMDEFMAGGMGLVASEYEFDGIYGNF